MLKIATTSICKNEAKYIQSWYDALKDEVDYITVMDTGSTDNTYELLQELASKDPRVIVSQKVITPWSFGDARNEAMKLIPEDTDIFISIDMDETFKPGFAKTLRDNWKDSTIQVLYKYAWNHNPDNSPLHTFTYSKICKNDGKWSWKYPIHECLIRSEVADSDAILDLTNQILLDHWQDTSVDRSSYLTLLKDRWKNFGGDMDALYYARECTFHKKHKEAIKVFKTIVDKEEKTTLPQMERAYINYMTGLNYFKIDDYDNAVKFVRRAIEISPTYRDPYVDLARIYMSKEYLAEAANVLKKCVNTTFRHFSWTEVNDVWGYKVWDLLSVASYNSGDKKTALIAVCKALNLEPNNENLKKNYSQIIDNITDKEI